MAADARADLTEPTRAPAADRDLGRLLGGRLRRQRRSLALTLADVAGAADVSTSYLSSIETGAAVPSLSVLARLARAVGLTLAEVLRGSATEGVTTGRIDAAGDDTLTPEGSRLEVIRLRAEPGTGGEAPIAFAGGDLFVYVVGGTLTLTVDGETTGLEPGDAVHCVMPVAVSWTAAAEASLSVWVAKRAEARSVT